MGSWLQRTESLSALGRGPLGVGEGPGKVFSFIVRLRSFLVNKMAMFFIREETEAGAGGLTQLGNAYIASTRLHKPGSGEYTCNPSIWEVWALRSAQGHL